MSNHYETLNVTRDAEGVVIESAYRALMKRYHPDKTNGDPVAAERAKEINAAYSTLRDPESRAQYDRALGQTREPFQSEPEPSWSHEPPTPHAAHQPARPASQGNIASAVFIGLAVLVGVGAVGSLAGIGAAPAGSADVDGVPLPTSTLQSSADADRAADASASAEGSDRPATERQNAPEREAQPDVDSATPTEKTSALSVPEAPADAEDTEQAGPSNVGESPKDLDGLF